MKTSMITLLLVALAVVSKAQAPEWSMPVTLVVPGYGSDTVWIGMDANGAAGYQPGLDSLADIYTPPFGIFCVDSTLTLNNCFNLKKDTKNFNPLSKIQFFNLFVRVDPTIQYDWINRPHILFDTSKYRYDDNGYRTTFILVNSNYGYINGIDVDSWGLCQFDTVQNIDYIGTDSISLIFESSNLNFNCNTNDRVMVLKISIGVNYYYNNVDYYYLSKDKLNITPSINNGIFSINYNNNSQIEERDIKIYSLLGNVIPFSITNNTISIAYPENGIYIISVLKNNFYITQKFIINR